MYIVAQYMYSKTVAVSILAPANKIHCSICYIYTLDSASPLVVHLMSSYLYITTHGTCKSRVEMEGYSIAYFVCIAAFKVLYR